MWNSRGLRGNDLESQINTTNALYRQKNLALVQKIPTPIKPIQINQTNRTITLAYFEQKSTVDYMGIVQGIPICFDAKETAQNALPICNIHQHQIDFMNAFKKQGGVSFLIVYFKKYDHYFFMPIEELNPFYEQAQTNGRKSIAYDQFNTVYQIPIEGGIYLHYLKILEHYLGHIK